MKNHRKTKRINKVRVLIFSLLIAIAITQLYPLLWLILSSLNTNGDLFIGSILPVPKQPQWENYVLAWNRGRIPLHFLNSLLVASVTVTLTVIISFSMGYALTRMKWPGSGIVRAIILLGVLIPVHVTLLPNFLVFTRIGIHTSYLAMMIPYIAFSFPIGVFLMGGYLVSIPDSLEDSAFVDGASIYKTISRIIFPMTTPAVMAIAILTFLFSWNEYIMAATFLREPELRTLPFSVTVFTGEYSSDYAAQFAVMTLASIPAILVYLVLSKRITSGIIAGALKG